MHLFCRDLHGPRRLAATGRAMLLILLAAATPAFALSPGDGAPPFSLPFLEEAGTVSAPAVFTEAPVTAVVFWNRGCPRCIEVASGMQALGDTLEAHGGRALGIAFGPDQLWAVRAFIKLHGVRTLQLWDEDGSIARAYGLGLRHLAVFLVDRSGLVRAAWGDDVDDLVRSVWPEAARVLGPAGSQTTAGSQPAAGSQSPTDSPTAASGTAPAAPDRAPAAPTGTAAPSGTAVPSGTAAPSAEPRGRTAALPNLSGLRLEGRMRLLSSEGARRGEMGLFGDSLVPGALFIYRWDVRYVWSPRPGLEIVPWLRLGNEQEVFLSEGPEQLSNPRASGSVFYRRGGTDAALGAYPLRVSRLLLQRWDQEDAPPLGGVSTCGCGSGGTGLSQRSLEVLGPDYTFEGASLALSRRAAGVRGWFAIPRRERLVAASAPALDQAAARDRRLLWGALVDLGAPLGQTASTGTGWLDLLGVRAGLLALETDGRSTPPGSAPPPITDARDERGWTVAAGAGPFHGISADAEYAGFRKRVLGASWQDGTALLAGARANRSLGKLDLWARAHRIRTEPGFDPTYAALTYVPNEEGLRIAAGAGLRSGAAGKEIAGFGFFRRAVSETEPVGRGRARSAETSLTLYGRPLRNVLAQAHGVRTSLTTPGQPVDKTTALSLDTQWEGWPAIEPLVRVDALRRSGTTAAHTIWIGSLWLRVVL